MTFVRQRIRDPLHNLIEFAADDFDNVMWQVIQTKPFQRLRRIKQLGFSEFVYPGATHTRFAHSVGVFHTARQLMKTVESHLGTKAFQTHRAKVCLAAALVHDVGHGPFSHAFETVGKRLELKMAHHELVSDLLIRDSEIAQAMKPLGSGFAADVADVISGSGKEDIYSAVVSSQFDADRLDYMRRDRLMTGTHHGAIDFDWLISNLEVGKVASGVDDQELEPLETFTLGPKAIYAAETYVLGLFQLYPTVYLHKATRGAEALYSELLTRLVFLVRAGMVDKTGLPVNHPLIAFAKESTELYLAQALDDTVIWGALDMMSRGDDSTIAVFSARLLHRDLYKSIDIREQINEALPPGTNSSVVDRGCQRALEYLGSFSQEDGGPPRLLIDQTSRKPYKRLQESKGPLNQIMIRTRDNSLIDVAKVSKIVDAIEEFKVLRAYAAADDTETKHLVKEAIGKGVEHALAS